MTNLDITKLQHDFNNSITTIRSISHSTNKLLMRAIETLKSNNVLTDKQIELFSKSMKIVAEEADKLQKIYEETIYRQK